MFLTTQSSASRTLQSRFSNVRISFLQTCGKDYDLIPHFILLTVWKITTMDESNEFPLTPHYLVGIGNSQSASSIFLSMVFAGFRTIPAMDVVKDPNKLIFLGRITKSIMVVCTKFFNKARIISTWIKTHLIIVKKIS